jgi:glycerol kinase
VVSGLPGGRDWPDPVCGSAGDQQAALFAGVLYTRHGEKTLRNGCFTL